MLAPPPDGSLDLQAAARAGPMLEGATLIAAVRRPGPDASGETLSRAVLSTLAYRDVFGYPMTALEVHRYLERVKATPDEVSRELGRLLAAGTVVADGELYALRGRAHLFATRGARQVHARRLWTAARAYARALATIPTVTMVAVTGSLACDNTDADADIDFMVVMEPGTLWRTRALIRTVEVADGTLGGRLCVNFFLTERALELAVRDLYVAQELAQMVPLYGQETYERLRAANSWVAEWLPNAAGAPREVRRVQPIRVLRAIARSIFHSRPAARLEKWESSRKLERYRDIVLRGEYTPFTHEATGHRVAVRRKILEAHAERLARRTPRVLFGQAYHLYLDEKLRREQQPYPPVGALTAAAVVRRAGFDVSVFDSMLSTSADDWRSAIDWHAPDLVVLFEDNFNYLTKMCLGAMREAALAMIRAAKLSGVPVVVCSADSSDFPVPYLEAGADYVVVGEGEGTLLELLPPLLRGEPVAPSVKGLIHRAREGKVISTGRRPGLRRLDDLPSPAWDLIDLDRYRQIWMRAHGTFALNVATTRGCPYHCNWCAKPIWGQSYAARSPEHVVAELVELKHSGRPDRIWFMDDIFGLKPGWVARFASLAAQHDVKLPFKCLSRPDLVARDGEAAALADAGCHTLWMGAESGSQKILDAMEKGTRVEQIDAATRALRSHGIRVGYFVQFGYPGETLADVRATLSLLRRNLPDELGISVSYPLPGTPFHERVRRELGSKQHWHDSSDLAMLFRGPFSTHFYRALHRYVHRDLAYRRAAAELRSGALWKRARPARGLAGLAWHAATQPFLWAGVRLLAHWPHRGSPPLPVALPRAAAAVPTAQTRE